MEDGNSPPSSLSIPFFFSFLLPFSHLPQILYPVSPCSSTGHLLVMYLLLAAVYYQYEGFKHTALEPDCLCWNICRLSYCVIMGKLLLNSLWLLQMVVRSEEAMSIYK